MFYCQRIVSHDGLFSAFDLQRLNCSAASLNCEYGVEIAHDVYAVCPIIIQSHNVVDCRLADDR